MMQFVERFLRDQSGATAIEYGLMAALVSIAIIAAAAAIGGGVESQYENVASKVQ